MKNSYQYLRRWLGALLYKYPRAYSYARQVDTVLKGNVKAGLRGICGNMLADCRNSYASYKNKNTFKDLRQLYLDAVLCCIKHRVNRWWECIPDAEFNSVPALNSLLLECVLRRAGDYNEYIRIKSKIHQLFPKYTQDDCYFKLVQYFAKTMVEIRQGSLTKDISQTTEKRLFLMPFTVWGERYVNMLINYCLPSLLTEGNLYALCKERQPVMFINTDSKSQSLIEQSDIIRRIRSIGVVVHYRMLDESLIKLIAENPNFNYWHLGMMQSLDLYIAKALRADYHLLLPDQIYAESFFVGVLRAASRGHKAITRLGLSTCMEVICPAVEPYRKNLGIAIPARDLASLAVTNVHSASASWIATGKDIAVEMPNACMIVWEGKDTLHMLSPHQTVLFLDNEIISTIKERFFITLDSELDKIIPEHISIYCPQVEDEMFLIEVTSEEQRSTAINRQPVQEFARVFWYSVQASMSYWRLFDQGIIDPLNRQMVTGRNFMSDSEIAEAKKAVKSKLLEFYPTVSKNQARFALEILQAIESHPNAKFVKKQIYEISAYLCSIAAIDNNEKNILTKFYHEAILYCIQYRVKKWWNILPKKDFGNLKELHYFLRETVLRRAGDYKTYLRIGSALKQHSSTTFKNEEFLYNLIEYYSDALDEIKAKTPPLKYTKRPIVIAFLVWGEKYTNMLLNYCLPSLLSDGNLGILCKERQPILYVHTNQEFKHIIENAEVVQRIKAMSVILEYELVREEFITNLYKNSSYKYWYLGLMQSLDLYYAQSLNADYHLLLPDTVYSDQHFSGILRAVSRGHKAIIRLIISTRMEGICPLLDTYRQDGVITIPAADLAALSVLFIHSASEGWNVTNKNIAIESSNSHVVLWEGKDKLYLYSPHQTILYLDNDVIQRLPKRFFLTLDSELDKIIPLDIPIYCPKVEDAICLIEATSEKQRPTKSVLNPIANFCSSFWFGTQGSLAYWRIFNEAVIDPLNRDMLQQRDYMSHAEIEHAKELINDSLLTTYPRISANQVNLAMKLLKDVQNHPDAKHMQNSIDDAARCISIVAGLN